MKNVYFDEKKVIHEIVQNNSERAFRSFFETYYSRLLQLSLVVLKNEEVAKDVVLEVFEKVWEQRAGLAEIENINKYLYVLVKNKSIDQLRKRKELIVLESHETSLKENIIQNNPEKILLDNELFEKINEAVLALPEKCRLVYRMVKEDGLKYKEVSELLNLSPKTIDNHLSNAMGKIRQEVSQYLGNSKTNSYLKVLKSIMLTLPF